MAKSRKKITIKKSDTYTIHKCTLISYDPVESCKMFSKVFGNKVSGCLDPPDDGLKARGVKWVKFKEGGKCEFHFVPPFTLTDEKSLKNLIDKQMYMNPLKTQLFENHVGMYVGDLTPVILSIIKLKIPYRLNRRGDGMYQFYFPIKGCLDYMDVDSTKVNFKKIRKYEPFFTSHTFDENADMIRKFEKEYRKKTLKRRRRRKRLKKTKVYLDPKHNNAPRKIVYLKNNMIKISGKDSHKGKKWTIKGKLDKKKNAILDFSSKGGPTHIKAKIKEDEIVFDDGNKWKRTPNLFI